MKKKQLTKKQKSELKSISYQIADIAKKIADLEYSKKRGGEK